MSDSWKHPNWNLGYLKEVYLRVRSAVWQFQGFEDTLAKFITLVFKMEPRNAKEEAVAILEGTKKQTLGQLVKELRKQAEIPVAFEKRLGEFVDDRNWVIHHSYRTFIETVHDPAACLKLMQRIEEIDSEAYSLNKLFWDSVAMMSDEYEAAVDKVDTLAQRIREQWKDKSD
jgi:hypothetical protein